MSNSWNGTTCTRIARANTAPRPRHWSTASAYPTSVAKTTVQRITPPVKIPELITERTRSSRASMVT